MRRVPRAAILLALVGMLLPAGIAQAELKITNVVYAWDIAALKYQNSNVAINFDGTWVPFWHQLDFDNKPWTDACGPGTSTRWAGNMYYGLYSEDNAPAGAPGFQETRNWELVDCDRNGDGSFGNADLEVRPPTYRVTWTPCTSTGTYCKLLTQDVRTACSTGNCAYEIVTTFFVNLDLNCDGTIDNLPLPTAGLCFFAEARTPPPPAGGPFWSGPLQARISSSAGEKTVSFAPRPTAVKLLSFAGRPVADGNLLTWETASERDNLGFNLYRSTELGVQGDRVNRSLIPSQAPGQDMGAAYQFVDASAQAGVTYYYTLEDIDASGLRTAHGPIALTGWWFYLPLIRK